MRLQRDESKSESAKRQSTRLAFVVGVSLLSVGQLAYGGLIAALEQTKMVGDINQKETQYEPVKEYVPSYSEDFVFSHAEEFGYKNQGYRVGCKPWLSKKKYPDLHKKLKEYASDLENYTKAVQNFQAVVPDLRKTISETGNHEICKTLRLHPEGMQGIFPSNQLSLSRAGYVEPMLPPFRSHKICFKRRSFMDMSFLVHDFERMCLQLKPSSKIVLVDMGASLAFHKGKKNPMLKIMAQYEKFGFPFDHIYAFEVTPQDTTKVFSELLPEKYFSSYHWINTGVSVGENDKMNPLHSIIKKFDEDDLIIVKLDIDTPWLELPLVSQLLEGGDDGIYHKLVDQFYFEHHIYLQELKFPWGRRVNGTIYDSLNIFTTLRKKGIAAHSWP